MERVKPYSMVITSANTGTNEVQVNNSARVHLYIADIASWNAGAGNTEVSLQGSSQSGTTHVPILGATITTSSNGIFEMNKAAGIPNLSVHFATAPTGTGVENVILLVPDDS